jgi:hypothetical protein
MTTALPEPPAKATATGAVDPAADVEQLTAGMKEVRSLLQRTGALLGTAATAVLSGLSYTQLHQIFPVPANVSGLSKVLLVASLAAAVIGSMWLAGRFLRAQRMILITSDDTKWPDDMLRGEDRTTGIRVLREHAQEELAEGLRDVELRALRLEKVARRLKASGDARAGATAAEADRLYSFVATALHRAAATILQDRSRRAFSPGLTLVAFLLAAVGIAGAFGFADYYKGQRGLTELRSKCVTAESAGVTDACKAFETSSMETKRKAAAATAKAAATKKLEAAQNRLSPSQRLILQRAKDCQTAVAGDPALAALPAATQTQVVGACAVAAP